METSRVAGITTHLEGLCQEGGLRRALFLRLPSDVGDRLSGPDQPKPVVREAKM